MIRALALLAALFWASAAAGQAPGAPRVAAALTDEQVRITSRFTGARIDVFGVVSDLRESDDIVVVIEGPPAPVRMVRKERRAGVWLNGAPHAFEPAPGYHAFASTRPLAEIEGAEELTTGALRLTPAASAPPLEADELQAFREGLARIRSADGVYRNAVEGVDLFNGGLFRTRVLLPPGSPTGEYRAEVYVFRDGVVTSARASNLEVVKVGLERFITNAANNHPMLYGIACVLFACLSGWAAAVAFRRR